MRTGAMGVRPMAASVVGVIRGGLRGTLPVQSTEQLLCNSSRPVSALIAKATVAEENELVMEAGEPVPRLVFGSVPSIEEAREATGELKEVLDGMYLPLPKSFESEASLIPENFLLPNTEIVNSGSGVLMETNTRNSGAEHVHQAFRLLSHSPAIQNIVASVASDQKVYEAVLANCEVKKLLLAYQTGFDAVEDEADVTQEGESGAGVIEKVRNLKDFVIKMVTNIPNYLPGLFGSSTMESASESNHKENTTTKASKSGSSFVEKLRNLKNSVVEMATKVPKYLPNLYGSSAAGSVSGSEHQGNTQNSPPEWSLVTHLAGLGIMVIMVVLFKRI